MIVTNLTKDTSIEQWITLSYQQVYEQLSNTNLVILPLTFLDNAEFDSDKAIEYSGKPIVILDLMEYGHSRSWKTEHVFGTTWDLVRPVPNPEYYQKLGEWIAQQNIVCYFKRELSKNIQDMNITKHPIEPIELLAPEVPSSHINREQFLKRNGRVFHLYGYSHIDRKRLHAWLQIARSNVVNSLEHAEEFIKKELEFTLLQEIPHQLRYPYSRTLEVQANCLLSVALPGAGVKCFRNIESSYMSVPIVADNKMKWTYPWDESNSVLLPIDSDGFILQQESVDIIATALLDKEVLLNKAYKATDNCNLYSRINYCNNLVKTIRKYL